MSFARSAVLAFLALFSAVTLQAQEEPRRSVDLTIGGVGLSLGDSRQARGLRLNYRDSRLQQATGINATIWSPWKGGHGNITGLSLGLPVTGGRNIEGLLVGVFGAEVYDSFRGISIAGLGMGAGYDITGLTINGLGMGAGHNIRGVSLNLAGAGAGGGVEGVVVGGLGVGAGGGVNGVVLGGLGAGFGGDVTGAAIGGLGVATGGRLKGLMVGGLGVGVGQGGEGVVIGGLGVGMGGGFEGFALGGIGTGIGGPFKGFGVNLGGMGVGGDATGVFINGIGMGAGGTICYLSLSGLGTGASRIDGLSATLGMITTPHSSGVMVAGLWNRIRIFEDERLGRASDYEARLEGVGISAFNQVLGHQQGLTIGVLNYARSLNGVQLGLINIVRDNPSGRKVLPVVNWGNTRR